MLTRCPHCAAVFRLTEAHLRAAGGIVQCGRCAQQFNAALNLQSVPEPQFNLKPQPAPTIPPATLTADAATAEADDGFHISLSEDDKPEAYRRAAPPAVMTTPAPEPQAERMRADEHDALDDEDFIEDAALDEIAEQADDEDDEPHISLAALNALDVDAPPPPAPRRWTWLWASMSVLLAAGLLAQLAYDERHRLASELPLLQPYLQRACAHLGCKILPRRDLRALTITHRAVSEHPRFQDALLVNTSFTNRAGFAQAYPIIELSLFDESGSVISQRRFHPSEYFADAESAAKLMPAHAETHIVLEVAAPPGNLLSFEFTFH